MTDEGTTAKLQANIESLPLADQRAVNSVWSIFSYSPHARRGLILQGILTMCCFLQLSLLSSALALAIRIDPFGLFPREVSLRVLGFTDAITLGRAAQASRSLKELADDDLLCEQHIERKCEKCGWGLPLLNDKKRRRAAASNAAVAAKRPSPTAPTPGASSSAQSTASQSQVLNGTTATSGNLKRSITATANAAALEKRNSLSRPPSPSPPSHSNYPPATSETHFQQPPAKRQCTGTGTSTS